MTAQGLINQLAKHNRSFILNIYIFSIYLSMYLYKPDISFPKESGTFKYKCLFSSNWWTVKDRLRWQFYPAVGVVRVTDCVCSESDNMCGVEGLSLCVVRDECVHVNVIGERD